MNSSNTYKILNTVELCIAEVLSVQPYDTYKHIETGDNKNTDTLFSVQARIDGIVNKPIIYAKPLNTGIKKIPLIGELILVFKLNSKHQSILNQEQWFYISTMDLNSSINHNSQPGYTADLDNGSDNIAIGKTIDQKVVSPLQPFEGDTLFEGRWGNSIRFGSTIKNSTDVYTIKSDMWIGDSVGDPITILSNGRKNKDGKQFVIESPETCASSIYLTSTQKLTKLKLNNKLQIGDSESAFAGSQIVGFADRIILKAKNDIIVLDSKTGIEINSPLIKVGVSDKKEPLLHSTAAVKLLKTLIRVVNTGVVDSNGVICTPIDKSLKKPSTKQALEQLTNDKVLFDKHIKAQ
jgi:hypothetical protein